jgi:hypothetical protein
VEACQNVFPQKEQTAESETFAKYLLEVGAGKNSDSDGNITLYPEMCCGDTVDSLIDVIYPRIAQGAKQDEYFKDRTLLSCKNDDVDDLNTDILAKFPGEEKVLMSADSIVTDTGAPIDYQPYQVEYISTLSYVRACHWQGWLSSLDVLSCSFKTLILLMALAMAHA